MGHTRALLKVQDGCDVFCTYCVVPYARGKGQSLPLKKVLTRIRGLAKSGYQEVVLTGVNLGRYGLDLHPEIGLLDMLEAIEKEKGPPRIRLSSIEPMELNRSLIDFIAGSKKICHHLHIPLQSGEDKILKRMGRPYSSDDFAEVIRAAYDEIKDLTIGMDVIAGFPGEENHNFENTYQFIEGLPFTYLHVFPFSPRKGTPAAKLKDHVPSPTIKERTSRLRLLGNKRRERVYLEQIGRTHQILVEGESDKGLLQGLSANYLRIYFKGKRELINRIIPITLTTLENGRLHGIPHE
jgi:threonylcarbamoyladenosine tRNA methylthiotransferase MtaB